MKKAPIKLLNIGTLDNGVTRFQSQLLIGSDTADFIMEDNELKHWEHGDKGFQFYKTDIPYQIVTDVKEMARQEL